VVRINRAKQRNLAQVVSVARAGGLISAEKPLHAGEQKALTILANNGPVEGHINRLKTVKRQMYGRAGFELLRSRILPLAA
jgi:hypothetical protein